MIVFKIFKTKSPFGVTLCFVVSVEQTIPIPTSSAKTAEHPSEKRSLPLAISPPTASINVTAETAVKKPGLGTQIGKRKFSIFSILCAAASFFIYPYILGILAILFAGIALFKKDYLGILGIIIAATSLGLDWFYLDIFPPPPIV
jgi:hypothetical protein